MYVSSRPILLPTGSITRHLVDIPISREVQGRLLSFSTPFENDVGSIHKKALRSAPGLILQAKREPSGSRGGSLSTIDN